MLQLSKKREDNILQVNIVIVACKRLVAFYALTNTCLMSQNDRNGVGEGQFSQYSIHGLKNLKCAAQYITFTLAAIP